MASRSLPPDTPGQGDPSCVVELVGPGRLGEECSSYSMFVGKVNYPRRLAAEEARREAEKRRDGPTVHESTPWRTCRSRPTSG